MSVIGQMVDKVAGLWSKRDNAAHNRWFLLDRELHDPAEDEFFHESVVSTLEQFILDATSPPYSIAIYGKWGQGKTTVARLLLQRLETNSSFDVIPEPISLWHYPADDLPKVLNHKLVKTRNKGTAVPSPNVRTTFTESASGAEIWARLKTEFSLLPALAVPIGIAVVGIIVAYWLVAEVASSVIQQTNLVAAPTTRGMLAVLDKWGWAPVATGLVSYLFNRFRAVEVTRTLEPLTRPSELAQDFEEQTKGKRPVVVLDDLDRLSPPKMIQALEVVKAYLSHREAVFIIPCDDEALRSAVESVKHLEEPSGDRFLEKFFQFSIRLPSYRRRQMKDYAKLMWSQAEHPFVQPNGPHSLTEEVMDEVLDLLVHFGTETPRQVKKILNEFSAEYLICMDRERHQAMWPTGLTRRSLPLLAKLAVLRSDFPAFHSALTTNQTLLRSLNRLLAESYGSLEGSEKEAVLPFVTGTDHEPANGKVVGPASVDTGRRNAELIRFLSFTRHISDDGIKPFLFYTTDESRMHLQSAFEEHIEKEILSGNYKAVQMAFENANDGGHSLIHLLLEVLEEAPAGLRLARGLEVAVYMADQIVVYEPEVKRLANIMTSRYKYAGSNIALTDPAKLFLVLSRGNDKLTTARILKERFAWASGIERTDVEVQSWATAVLLHADLLAELGVIAEAQPVIELLGVEGALSIIAKRPLTDPTIALLGGNTFQQACTYIAGAQGADDSPEAWFVMSSAAMCYSAFGDTVVKGVSVLLTSHVPYAQSIGKSVLGTLSLSRAHVRQLLNKLLEACKDWPDTQLVDYWIKIITERLDEDSSLLTDEEFVLLAATLAKGLEQGEANAISTATKHAGALGPIIPMTHRTKYLSALVQSIGQLRAPTEVAQVLVDGSASLVEEMSHDTLKGLVAALDSHVNNLADPKRSQVAQMIVEKLSSMPLGLKCLLPNIGHWLDILINNESWQWEARSYFGVGLAKLAIRAGEQTIEQVVSQIGGRTFQSGNQWQWKLGVCVLKEFGPNLAKTRAPWQSIFNRYSGISDPESKGWALLCLAHALPGQPSQHHAQWNAWTLEFLRQQPASGLEALEAGLQYATDETLFEGLRAASGNNQLWQVALHIWMQRGQIMSVDQLVNDLGHGIETIKARWRDLVITWAQAFPTQTKLQLSELALAQSAHCDEKDRRAWVWASGQFRNGLAAISGQGESVCRLLRLPPSEVLELLDDLALAYPEVVKDDQGMVREALLEMIQAAKTERELRGALTFARKGFGRLPSVVRQAIIDRARVIRSGTNAQESRLLGTLLGELGAPRGHVDLPVD